MREYSIPTLMFCYLFFALFVFTSLSVLVPFFSSTFSQLFSLLIQDGRIFDILLSALLLLGFVSNLFILILSSWNQKEGGYMKGLAIFGAMAFIFLFVFNLSGIAESDPLLDLAITEQERKDIFELLFEHWTDAMTWCLFYIGFVLLPLLSFVYDSPLTANSFLGRMLRYFRPSINVIIYTLVGFSLQNYFFKNYKIEYIDLVGFILGFILLWVVYVKRKQLFGFYERINLFLLCLGIVFFALTYRFFDGKVLLPRYCFYTCAFVAWCAEWGYNYAKKEEKRV